MLASTSYPVLRATRPCTSLQAQTQQLRLLNPVFGLAAAVATYHATREEQVQVQWLKALPVAFLLSVSLLLGVAETLIDNVGQLSSFTAGTWLAWLFMPQAPQPVAEATDASALDSQSHADPDPSAAAEAAQTGTGGAAPAEVAPARVRAAVVVAGTAGALSLLVAARNVPGNLAAPWLDLTPVQMLDTMEDMFEQSPDGIETPWFRSSRGSDRDKLLRFNDKMLQEDQDVLDDPEGVPMDWEPRAYLA